jgi:hypothetical protein
LFRLLVIAIFLPGDFGFGRRTFVIAIFLLGDFVFGRSVNIIRSRIGDRIPGDGYLTGARAGDSGHAGRSGRAWAVLGKVLIRLGELPVFDVLYLRGEKNGTRVHIGDRDDAVGLENFHVVQHCIKTFVVSREEILDGIGLARAEFLEQGFEFCLQGCNGTPHAGLELIEQGRIELVKNLRRIVDARGIGQRHARERVDVGDAWLVGKGEHRTAYALGGPGCFQDERRFHVRDIDGE